MDKELVKGIIFKIDNTKKLGVMRIDWCGSNDKLCNKWIPSKLLTDLKTSSTIDLKKLQQELNELQFDLLLSFQKVEKYCHGTGYDKEKLFSISMTYNYAIKLVPTQDSYSYIFVYIK